MSDMQKCERFSFGIPSSLNYGVRPSHHDKMSLNELRAAGVAMDAVDKCKSRGYFYPIQISQGVKKAGTRRNPLPVDIECVTTQMFPCDQTAPGTSWAIMEAIKPYRRFSPRRLFYIATTTLPAEPLQPVISFGRGPPTNQT